MDCKRHQNGDVSNVVQRRRTFRFSSEVELFGKFLQQTIQVVYNIPVVSVFIFFEVFFLNSGDFVSCCFWAFHWNEAVAQNIHVSNQSPIPFRSLDFLVSFKSPHMTVEMDCCKESGACERRHFSIFFPPIILRRNLIFCLINVKT